ncbi:hypothetical protein [Nocardia alni]|uniref:hypothetical protein n=1 Tax=Nocardia alni TaxID=2815723 RepID=UPI001C21F2DF|nr:hypothetical protein [Nocardia alni]
MRSQLQEASPFGFRMWWRAGDCAEWSPGTRLLVAVDDGESVELEQLSWTTGDGAQFTIGFSSDMASCYGHRHTAHGDVVEVRGEIDDSPDRSVTADSAREYEFDTSIGDEPAGRLRLVLDDGSEASLRSVTWRDRSGNACSAVLRSPSPSGTLDVTELVTEVRASSEHPQMNEFATNLIRGSTAKWLAPFTRATLEFQLSQPITLDRYILTSANDEPRRDPETWTLRGSADGSLWQVLDTRVGQSFPDRHLSRMYRIARSGTYDRYRLNILRNQGAGNIQLESIRFIAAASGFVGYRHRAGQDPVVYRGVRVMRETPRPTRRAERLGDLTVGTGGSRRANARPVFEDSAPAAEITSDGYLYRRNARGAITHTVQREPDGSLLATGKNESVWLDLPLAQWFEQAGTILTWRRLADAGLTLCLLDAAGNPLWRQNSPSSTTTPPPARPHEYGGPTLEPGSRLRRQSLTSPSGSHTLLHHHNGNLVLYCNTTHTPVWMTGTDWLGDSRLDLTSAGDLVLRTSCGAPVWHSGTTNLGVIRLEVRDDGALALLNATETIVWQALGHAPCSTASGLTPPRGAVLRRGQSLHNQSLTSAHRDVVLAHEPGNGIWLYDADGAPAWYAGTATSAGLTLDIDGYLRVLADNGTPLEQLAGPADHLEVESSGEIRLYTEDSTVVWSSLADAEPEESD